MLTINWKINRTNINFTSFLSYLYNSLVTKYFCDSHLRDQSMCKIKMILSVYVPAFFFILICFGISPIFRERFVRLEILTSISLCHNLLFTKWLGLFCGIVLDTNFVKWVWFLTVHNLKMDEENLKQWMENEILNFSYPNQTKSSNLKLKECYNFWKVERRLHV